MTRRCASGRWPDGAPAVVTLPTPLNAVAVAPDGEIVAGRRRRQGLLSVARRASCKASRGGARRRSSRSRSRATASSSPPPASAARSPSSIAPTRKLERTLVGPGLPVWSVAFFPDSRTLLTGGADRMIRRWDAITGEPIGAVIMGAPEDPLAAFAGDPGAEVFRACVACHTLNADEGVRAGPTLAGIFGRKIATPAGLQFLRRAQEARHRLDAGDGGEAVRGRSRALHARAPRCRSRPSARPRTAPRWCGFLEKATGSDSGSVDQPVRMPGSVHQQ